MMRRGVISRWKGTSRPGMFKGIVIQAPVKRSACDDCDYDM